MLIRRIVGRIVVLRIFKNLFDPVICHMLLDLPQAPVSLGLILLAVIGKFGRPRSLDSQVRHVGNFLALSFAPRHSSDTPSIPWSAVAAHRLLVHLLDRSTQVFAFTQEHFDTWYYPYSRGTNGNLHICTHYWQKTGCVCDSKQVEHTRINGHRLNGETLVFGPTFRQYRISVSPISTFSNLYI